MEYLSFCEVAVVGVFIFLVGVFFDSDFRVSLDSRPGCLHGESKQAVADDRKRLVHPCSVHQQKGSYRVRRGGGGYDDGAVTGDPLGARELVRTANMASVLYWSSDLR